MDFLLKSLRQFCDDHGPDRTYWVAYSGGLDSHVLLHLLAQIQSGHSLKLKAVHIHHGLSPYADAWRSHCFEKCLQLNIELYSREIKVDKMSERSVEEIARELRYEQLLSLMNENDILLTAHHQDDQAETVLLQMLRGAGPKGLASMPRFKKFGPGFHARPLLDFTRAQLQAYAEQHSLQWIDDESNHNIQLSRNFVRSEILPILKKRWPSVSTTLARVAENCSNTQQVLDEMILGELDPIRGRTHEVLSVSKLMKLDSTKQKLVLRAWISELNFSLPSMVKLEQIQIQCLHAREDKMPLVMWGNVEIRRFRNELYALKRLPTLDLLKTYQWDLMRELNIPNGGILRAVPHKGRGVVITGEVIVRFRRGGEKVLIRGCHHTLKNLFNEWEVPYWQRERIPLIYVNEKLVAVPGYCLSDEHRANQNQMGYDFTFSP